MNKRFRFHTADGFLQQEINDTSPYYKALLLRNGGDAQAAALEALNDGVNNPTHTVETITQITSIDY